MKKTICRQIIILAITIFLAACTSVPQDTSTENDTKLEKFNQTATKFNLSVDRFFLRPLAVGIQTVTPRPILTSITNINRTSQMPVNIINGLLAGQGSYASNEAGDFLLNVFFGFGLIDWAGTINTSTSSKFDLSTTLRSYDFSNGSYVQIPFFGPATTLTSTDLLTSGVEKRLFFTKGSFVLNPYFYLISAINTRIGFLSTDQIIYNSSSPYETLKSIYLQNLEFRQNNLLGIQNIPKTDPALDDL